MTERASTQARNSAVDMPLTDPNFRRLSRKISSHSNDAPIPQRERLPLEPRGVNEMQSTSVQPNERVTPVLAGFGQLARPTAFPPFGPAPVPENSSQAGEFWRRLKEFWSLVSPRVGGSGGGDGDFSRCLRAASGSTDDWEEFCRTIPSGLMSKTVGGETAKRACWSKTYESGNNRTEWCDNQFGNFDPR